MTDLVPLKLNFISKIVGNDDLALLELVTNDGFRQLSVVCEASMARQIAIRVADAPIRQRMLPEVLWNAFGKEQQQSLKIIFANFHDGEYMVFLFDEEEGTQWPIRASDAVLFAIVAKIPMTAMQRVVDSCGAPVDKTGKKVMLPLHLLSVEMLNQELEKAVNEENYEKASLIRDEIKKRNPNPSSPPQTSL